MISGKVYTRDTKYNRPYYVIKFDENHSADGHTQPETTKWVAHNVSLEFLEPHVEKLIRAVKDVESLYAYYEALEIDFTITDDGILDIGKTREQKDVIGMARPMSDKEFTDTKAFAKCNYLDFHHVLSDTAYCDTVRMLGNNPRPLEFSLYKEMIDNEVWNTSMTSLGYEGTLEDIIVRIGNKPYASVNNIIKSMFPEGLDLMLKYKLENYYEEKIALEKNTEGCIEKNLIISSYSFDIDERLDKLAMHGFTSDEISTLKQTLYMQAENVINSYDDRCKKTDENIKILADIREQIVAEAPCEEKNSMKLFKYIEKLIGAVKQYGMSELISHEYCVSASQKFYKIFAEGDRSQKEILYKVSRELWANEKKTDQFKGVLDIRGRVNNNIKGKYAAKLKLGQAMSVSADVLTKYIEDVNIGFSPARLAQFIAGSIAASRKCIEEYIKCMGLIIDIVIRLGEIMGIAYEDMSYLEVQDLLGYHSRDSYIQIINSRRLMYHANTYLVLPGIICNVGDIDVIDVIDNV